MTNDTVVVKISASSSFLTVYLAVGQLSADPLSPLTMLLLSCVITPDNVPLERLFQHSVCALAELVHNHVPRFSSMNLARIVL